jgi:hypothetical protein
LNAFAKYCYYLLQVEVWLIAMKYFHSAMQSSVHPIVEPAKVYIIKWAGIVLYCFFIFILYLCDVITFPGNFVKDMSLFNAYIAWAQST